MQLDELRTQFLAEFEQRVPDVFDQVALPDVLDKACRYAMGAGGKRVRPLLVAMAFFVFDSPQKHRRDMMMRACLAVELLHGYSLVHDDLPCMDDDDLRRGRPTCHIIYGENVALLVGDVLQSLAFEVLSLSLSGLDYEPYIAERLSQVFAPRARRMVAGQMNDVLGEKQQLTQEKLQAIHQDKTGALIEASVLMGGICAGADDEQLAYLHEYAKALGLAFQVQDDILDVIADTQSLGKRAGSDEKLDKSTYVKLMGVKQAQCFADELFNQACNHAKALQDTHQNNVSGNVLEQFARWVQARQK